MARKMAVDPDKKRLRQEELSRITGVPIEPATEAEAAAFNMRISQIGRAPTPEVTVTVADAKPEVVEVRSPEDTPVADEPRASDVAPPQDEKPEVLPDKHPVASVEHVEPNGPQETLSHDEPTLPTQLSSESTTPTIVDHSAVVDTTTVNTPDEIPTANVEIKRSRGRPRVIPLDAKGVLIRTPPDIKQRLKEIKGGEGPAGLSLIRLALDLIDAAGSVDTAQDAVAMTRSVISADNKNIAAQAARDLFIKRYP